MKKVYTSAVVIIPPKEKWEPIQEIRKLYDTQFKRWMPHITLLYPFYPKNQYNEILKKFIEIGAEFSTFKISLEKFKYFKHGNQNFTIWIDPIPHDIIAKLQSELLRIAPDCNDVINFKGGYHPHLSVGQFKGKFSNFKIKIDELQNSGLKIKFEVKEFCFIWRENEKNSRF